jgi:hypothetical protein
MSHSDALTGTPQHSPISIVNLHLIQSGVVEASFDVDTGCGFLIQGFAILDEPKQPMRVVLPVSQRIDHNGTKLYSQLVKIHPAVKAAIDQAAMEAYKATVAASYMNQEVGHE